MVNHFEQNCVIEEIIANFSGKKNNNKKTKTISKNDRQSV
jgi:hypothetical protein